MATGESSREIVAKLCESGFTHVMFCPPVPETAVEFDPTLGRLLAPWIAGRAPLFRQDLTDGDGVIAAIRDLRARPPRTVTGPVAKGSALGSFN